MGTGVKLGRGIMAAIGRELRAMYADIVAEGVPEQFAEILRRLDESGGKGARGAPPNR
jgi:Anti-sigma factor NepR